MLFHVTYSIVTPESAEQGDESEHGFVLASGAHRDMEGIWGEAAAAVKAQCGMSLRDAARLMGYVEDSGSWFTETDGRRDYQTGAETRFSFHPGHNVTPASYGRLARLLGA